MSERDKNRSVAEKMALKDDINVPLLGTLGVLSVLLLVVVVVATQALYYRTENQRKDELWREAEKVPSYERTAYGEQLASVRDVRDAVGADGVARVNIDTAMAIVAANNGVAPSTRPAAATGPATR